MKIIFRKKNEKLSLFLGLCGSLNFAMSANALVGSVHIQVNKLDTFSPLTTEENAFLPKYRENCDALYGKLRETHASVQYNIDDHTGRMTGTVRYLGISSI